MVAESRRAGARRRGNAAVELAFTLPLIITIVFGSVEVCGLMFARQALQSVAHECARVAIGATATDSDVQTRMSEIATQRGITSVTVTTTPSSIEGLTRGTKITVLASADASSNTILTRLFTQQDIQANCVMVKEL